MAKTTETEQKAPEKSQEIDRETGENGAGDAGSSGAETTIGLERGEGKRKRRTKTGLAGAEAVVGESTTSPGAAAEAAPAKKTRTRRVKTAPGEALATLVVSTIDYAVCASLGAEAAINPVERGFIEPALANLIDKTPPAALERLTLWGDIIMLGAGSVLWLTRISKLQKEKAAERQVVSQEQELPGLRVGDELPLEAELWRNFNRGNTPDGL
jgi:hypothetical protein